MTRVVGIERARYALEQGGRLPGDVLAAAISESWQRCLASGLDPRAMPHAHVVPFAEVSRKRDAMTTLRGLALAEMKLLHSQIAGSHFTIALADADGVVLDTISDHRAAESSATPAVLPGSDWSEARQGTNALGLAALVGRSAAVHGGEHFFGYLAHLSCMAVPILDSSGRTVGLLDASCANEARQQHTHALVRMAVTQIETGLIFKECSDSHIVAFHPRAEYLHTLSAGLLAISPEGVLVSLSRPGTALLAGLPASAGHHFDELFESSFGAAMDRLLRGGTIRIRDRTGSVIFMVCRQIGRRGKTVGLARLPHLRAGDPLAADFACEDPALRSAMSDLAPAIALGMPIHITGETGTGKELMARHVHRISERRGDFVALNCGAIPEPLFVAEIFGHDRGAFTNARSEGAPGLARAADGGTLFLDEVADIPPAAQTALLRFLDSMEVRPVGGQRACKVDVRIVSATNRDLADLVARREFRADLFYRLNAFTIRLPPLARRNDFALVVQHLMQQLAPGTGITDTAVERLSRRRWPGNIRELRSVLQRALVRSRMTDLDEQSFETDEAVVPEVPTVPDESCDACRGHALSERWCRQIRLTYRNFGDNVSRTARELNLSRTTIYRHLA